MALRALGTSSTNIRSVLTDPASVLKTDPELSRDLVRGGLCRALQSRPTRRGAGDLQAANYDQTHQIRGGYRDCGRYYHARVFVARPKEVSPDLACASDGAYSLDRALAFSSASPPAKWLICSPTRRATRIAR